VLLFASLTATIALVEGLIRIFDPLGISFYAESRKYELDKEPDDRDLIYRHKSNYGARYQGVAVTFNELGLRDDPVLAKRAGEFRIVVLGDSVAFGWGVAQTDIFASRLEPLLTEKLRRPVTVVNGGVGSYNTKQQHTWLTRVALKLVPDAIIVVYSTNDIESHDYPFDPYARLESFQNKTPPQVIQMLLGKLWAYRLANHVWTYSRKHTYAEDAVIDLRTSPGWQESMLAISAIDEIGQAATIPTVIFLFSWSKTMLEAALLSDLERASPNSRVLETFPWFSGLDRTALLNSIVDAHPNLRGHEILANGIANAFVEAVEQPARSP
jgi:lysophospholipase L1-like esterase